jgi:diguanylate cyclase (GGDEF)-like protein/PAS domain S-box-containing protein
MTDLVSDLAEGTGSPRTRSATTRLHFAHHRAVLADIPHVIFVLDVNGVVLNVSPEVRERLGWEPSEIRGKSAFEFIHPGDHQRVAVELMREITDPEEPAPSLVIRIQHADGRWRDSEVIGKNRLDDPLINGVIVGVRDVSGQSLSQRVLFAGDYLYQSVSTVASDGTTIFDANGNRVYTSASLLTMLGYSLEEMNRLGPAELMFPDDLGLWKTGTRQALRSADGVARVECRIVRKDGTPFWIEGTVVNLLNDSGVKGVVIHIRDIDDRRQLELQLVRQANIDELTGLANRRSVLARLEEMETLLFCDLDGFKRVNDELGHAVGDRLLQTLGRELARAVPSTALAARLGGDEFCVLSNAMSNEDAQELARHIVDRLGRAGSAEISRQIAITAKPAPIGVSIGIATDQPNTEHDSSQSSLLSRADHAMYNAKRAGTNCIAFATTK